MHTGLEEAFNLGWKLAAMAEGWGGPALLASYEIERRPIARAQCRTARRNPITPSRQSPAGTKASPAGRPIRRWLSVPEHIKLQYGYDGSRLRPDGTPPSPMDTTRLVPSTQPGTRAPHAWLDDGSSTLDLFGDGFVLLRLGAHPPDAPRADRGGNGARRADARGHAAWPIPRSRRCTRPA